MKILFYFLLFISFLCLSCKSLPVNKDSSLIERAVVLNEDSSKLQIFFPQFEDENGRIIEGDGIVIILPDKKTIVIDGFLKKAENQYIDFLKSLNITKIDYLIASHYHADHIGTFSKLISEFSIGTFYSNGVPINTETSKNLIKKLESQVVIQKTLSDEDNVFLSDDCYIKVYGPIITEQDKYNAFYNPGPTEKLINSTSLVFKLIYNDFSILFTGDMYRKGMNKICKKYGEELSCSVLKVPHHGEWYTTNAMSFVKTANAEYGIIQDNRYITNMIFLRYKLNKTKLLYRNTNGYIKISSDGNDYLISEETF